MISNDISMRKSAAMSRILAIPVLCCALLTSIESSGEVVRFTNGAAVRGRVEGVGEYVAIRTSDGQLLRVKRSLIAAIAPEASAETPKAPSPPLVAPTEDARPETSDLAQALDRTMTVEFQQTPLTEVVQFLRAETGLNFAIDPDLKADEIAITLSLKDMKLVNILRWIAHAGKVAIVVRGDGPVIRIAGKGRSSEGIAAYDVRTAMLTLIDRPSQPFTMAEGGASPFSQAGSSGPGASFGRSANGRDVQDLDLQRRGHNLIELFVRTTGPQNWDHAFVSGRLPAEDYLAGD
jgi:hypothetical protein